ncbi:hypothetical protein AGOR_G00077740 [Albula goreensis]|uniref:SprT-like domain-containing protein n=1 Tax=Albula goreensis TaxID=1534307 RepID=A0A8T3DW92_9TELE|nr:hypothetical protein AGOR_G00077740 [Albula goreensis]
MDSATQSLFKRVAGKLGWNGPGALDSAEKELSERIGKDRRPATGGHNATPIPAVRLDLIDSDSDSSGKENRPGNSGQNRVLLDSSDDDFDQFLIEKATPKRATQRPLCPPQINSCAVQEVSSESDSSFEKFLSRVKTPKSKPVATAANSSEDSLKHFIVDSFSSDDDFVTEKKREPAPKSKPKTPKPPQVPRPAARRPPSQWDSPVFLSDSDEDEGVVIKSTWKSRHTPRRPRSAGQEHERKSDPPSSTLAPPPSRENVPSSSSAPPSIANPSSSSSSSSSTALQKQTHRAPPSLDDSASSEEEFLSLIDRLKRKNGTGSSSSTQGLCHVAEPKLKERPCLSVPSGLGLSITGPRKAEKGVHTPVHKGVHTLVQKGVQSDRTPVQKGVQSDRTPVQKGVQSDRTPAQPTGSRPHISLTEPRPTSGSRTVVCKTPGCFLQSLSAPGSIYCRNFKQNKEELTGRLYQLYNSSIFDGKLPADMSVSWNKKMRKTAGYCISGQERGGGKRYARIELSEKVCDSADRLRDTLVHEMCHAATWLINGVRDGHGSFWKLYARKSTLAHPELPMVTRCHSYDINYKYQYQCSRCKNTIGRHSKSLDTQRFVCALCTGQLVLLTPAKPRAATPFATYVKENYGTARQELAGQSHAEVMRKLSADFASKTRLSQS